MHALHGLDLVLSLAVVALWVRKSYARAAAAAGSGGGAERAVETLAAAFFLAHYALRLLRSGLSPSACFAPAALLDLATAVPLAVAQRGEYACWLTPAYLRALSALLAYEQLEAADALDGLSETQRRALVVGARFGALVAVSAGTMFVFEALGDAGRLHDVLLDTPMGEISFYQMCGSAPFGHAQHTVSTHSDRRHRPPARCPSPPGATTSS